MFKKTVVKAMLLLQAGFTCTAFAEAYPAKPIRLVVPWPAGGGADSVGRAIAVSLTQQLGQSVIVDNVAGAGGNIGTQQFVRAAPDGYTLLLATSSTNSANPYLYRRVGFDPVKDFAPIVSVSKISSLLVVPTNSPYKSVHDIVVAAKAAPGSLAYASGGVGNSAHLGGALFASVAQINVIHVPYKGSAPALSDLMGGQVAFMLDTGAYSQVNGGKIRVLAVAAPKRHPMLPKVPTMAEAGLKGVEMNAWYGVAAPAGTPADILNTVNKAVNAALKSGDLAKRLADIGAEPTGGSKEEFSAFWNAELQRYAGLVKLTGATLD